MASIYHSTYAIDAAKLNDTPSNYFVLNTSDRYVLLAILYS
jgi:hypothetical protein